MSSAKAKINPVEGHRMVMIGNVSQAVDADIIIDVGLAPQYSPFVSQLVLCLHNFQLADALTNGQA